MALEFGLFEVAGSASLTLVFFPALVLLAVLGLRFAYYAFQNRQRTDLATQTPLWTHLLYVGLLAALYGGVGVLEIVSSIQAPYKRSLMLAMALLLAFAIREIHTLGGGDDPSPWESVLRGGFVVLVVGLALAGELAGSPRLLAGAEGLGGLAVLGYGATFYHQQTSNARLRGTMIDSLVRHLLPVLTFAALVNVTALAFAVGIDRNVVPHIQVVFIVMAASTLMTATIKLQQNLASL